MILKGEGRAEKSHHPVSPEFIDRATACVNLIQKNLKAAVHDLVDIFRIELFGQFAGFRNVGKHHGHDLAFTFHRTSGGEDFFGQVFRGVRQGMLEIGFRGLLGPSRIMTALDAEFAVRGNDSAALRADKINLSATFLAEPGIFWNFCLTFRTYHGFPPIQEGFYGVGHAGFGTRKQYA
jgi:hypothetical protein